jgi:uncharacterized membrane protein YGL010W
LKWQFKEKTKKDRGDKKLNIYFLYKMNQHNILTLFVVFCFILISINMKNNAILFEKLDKKCLYSNSNVAISNHFISDVIFGASIGILIGTIEKMYF